jgi:plastocyanin domain-containing protein
MKTVLLAILIAVNFQPAFAEGKEQVIDLQVTEKGFEPSSIDVKPGVPVTLKVTRKTDSTCATKIQIQSKSIKRDLPLNTEVKINLGKLEKGEIRFACGMDMITGKIIVK